jgi:L-aminopeptidase/D-esterase-like protein
MHKSICDVEGILAGHYSDKTNATGCTIILCPDGATGGVDIRGAAPGTRETDLLNPINSVQEVHGILLSGGSAFGLEAASGVMSFLSERNIGYPVGPRKVPIVPAAILFDLGIGSGDVFPGKTEGYLACQNASTQPLEQGSVGAGTGATVGKALGIQKATKGGLGTSSLTFNDGLVIGAVVAVNAFGDVVDPNTGRILAGPRQKGSEPFCNTMDLLLGGNENLRHHSTTSGNTTIGVVATNAVLSKAQTTKIAAQAHDGLALAIRPCHTMSDGDAMFAMATGKTENDFNLNRICAGAVAVTVQAVMNAIQSCSGLAGIPSSKEVMNGTK